MEICDVVGGSVGAVLGCKVDVEIVTYLPKGVPAMRCGIDPARGDLLIPST